MHQPQHQPASQQGGGKEQHQCYASPEVVFLHVSCPPPVPPAGVAAASEPGAGLSHAPETSPGHRRSSADSCA